uniref:Probable glycine dehydrogenase (decarboxylating) subunit 1 n=1 Tax=Candidatus Kentrum sp. MB TaxID=2138164 RepID=A0A451B780_9GAMM|nr:MAG: glycine dehydrogenase (decarboxylating) alpha subunit [Candidatus Kentron sp. MB]VFK28896.1 MAG: glycine dehydrogenase (decarboxylating) alpha subunit [Candidatus Kentron sp. MB]VFK74143.1 MAG: glycine dehydrogenase (decarboxylating) alpha subunit [Candidatus Kentron sp. MB]
MPFIPHTQQDIHAMLDAIGVRAIEELFDEIPQSLRHDRFQGIPPRLDEMGVTRLMSERAAQDRQPLCFLGAGAYEHHIPAAVWQITTRGEFYSAYTPYQAEASQGTLQLLYEYQTMMTELTGMAVSNASLYDGASALAEAVLMAVRANGKSKSRRILAPRTLHPKYRAATHAIVKNQDILLEQLEYDHNTGCLMPDALPDQPGDFCALVIPQPNFLGNLEEVHALTDWAHQHNALVIAVVNPMALALIQPPGAWGQHGADVVCGEGQPLGVPLSSGGPYFGILCCRQNLVRQMPGRIIGGTVDRDGNPGYTLTLQAREQHIRRSKATSNICTNQSLLVTAATLYLSLMGPEGLARVASACHANTRTLIDRLSAIAGVRRAFPGPFFHEAVLQFDRPVTPMLAALQDKDILGGYDLGPEYPELGNALLVCATETKTDEDLARYADALRDIMTA